MQKKSKKGWIFLGIVFIITVVALIIALCTEDDTRYNSYIVFQFAMGILLLGMFWKYSKKTLRRTGKIKDILLNAMFLIAGLILWPLVTISFHMAGEYCVFAHFGVSFERVISYILQEMPYVYRNNSDLPLWIAFTNLIVYLFAWSELPESIWEDFKEMKNGISSIFTVEVYAFIENKELIFADEYCFAEGKKIVAGVPCKNRLVIFSEELAKEISEREAPDEENHPEMAYFASRENLIHTEIHQNSISLEQLADADLNFDASYLETKMLGDFYIVDFVE